MDIPKELQNNVRYTSFIEEPKQKLPDIKVEQSEDNFDIETSSILGGELEINGVVFPAPTTAFLMFLDLINSPFIFKNEPTLADVYDVLFILKYREQAVSDIYGMFSAKKYLDKYEYLVEKSPEYLEVVLKYRERYEQKLQKFHALAASFGEKLGVFEIQEVTNEISEYIASCFGGFNMLPKGDGDGKKKDLTANG
jgi:hypothetical protein